MPTRMAQISIDSSSVPAHLGRIDPGGLDALLPSILEHDPVLRCSRTVFDDRADPISERRLAVVSNHAISRGKLASSCHGILLVRSLEGYHAVKVANTPTNRPRMPSIVIPTRKNSDLVIVHLVHEPMLLIDP